VVQPAHEHLGEVLLALGRADDARVHFERALELTPQRAAALHGLARAAEAAGDHATAERVRRQRAAFWRGTSR
jgi:cytochrome c-type biogenesis protein CcmH/NrfG